MTAGEILTLARAYSELTGRSLSGVGDLSCSNEKIFVRLAEGRGANTRTIERAHAWFVRNWPEGAAWPLPEETRSLP
jgi:hypothetical protein